MSSAELNSINKRRICLGVISGAHGIGGQVRIRPYTDQPQDMVSYGPLTNKDGTFSIETESFKVVKNTLVATISGIDTRAAAAALHGTELFVDRDVMPETDDDEWYYSDLIGLRVDDPEGRAIGAVSSILNYGAGDLIEVDPKVGGDTVLVPFTAKFVPEVDIAGGRLTIDLPEGWIENSNGEPLRKKQKEGESQDA